MVLDKSKCHMLTEYLSSVSNKQVFLGAVNLVEIAAAKNSQRIIS